MFPIAKHSNRREMKETAHIVHVIADFILLLSWQYS